MAHIKRRVKNVRISPTNEAIWKNTYISRKGNNKKNKKRNLCMLALNNLKAYVKLNNSLVMIL